MPTPELVSGVDAHMKRLALHGAVETRLGTLAPGVFDGISASMTQRAGFQVAYMSGAAVAASSSGLPDIGLATQTEFVSALRMLANLLDIPLVADADTGFGDVTHVFRTVRDYEAGGAAAIQFEDQQFPKKCGHLQGKTLIGAQEFASKIEVATQARRDPATMIVARTDSCSVYGFSDAIDRANLYVEAGADMVFVEAPESMGDLSSIPNRVKVPAVLNLVANGRSPKVPLSAVSDLGFGLAILPGINLAAAMMAMRSTLDEVRTATFDLDLQPSPADLFQEFDLAFWETLRARFGTV